MKTGAPALTIIGYIIFLIGIVSIIMFISNLV